MATDQSLIALCGEFIEGIERNNTEATRHVRKFLLDVVASAQPRQLKAILLTVRWLAEEDAKRLRATPPSSGAKC